MYAVAAVIAQRAFERKRTPKEVCLKPYQFSCWNGKSLKSLEHLLKVPQAQYAINCTKWASLGGLFAPLFPLLCYDITWNEGVIRPIQMIAPEGSIVNCKIQGVSNNILQAILV